MNSGRKTLAMGILLSFALGLVCLPQPRSFGAAFGAPQIAGGGVPAYHAQLPEGQLPATLSAKLFTDPIVQNAYAVAGRNRKILYQQPCYCYCDRSQGHGSLLDCFVSKHGSGCEICMREAFYISEQLRKGKTAAQIRDGIERGDWQQVDSSKYQKYPPAK